RPSCTLHRCGRWSGGDLADPRQRGAIVRAAVGDVVCVWRCDMSAPKKTKRKAKEDQKKVGRPLIIKTAAEMDQLVDEYRAQCLADKEPVTLTGLILHLGLSSRQSLDDYGKRPEFIDSV